jgi:hypothetical protein
MEMETRNVLARFSNLRTLEPLRARKMWEVDASTGMVSLSGYLVESSSLLPSKCHEELRSSEL